MTPSSSQGFARVRDLVERAHALDTESRKRLLDVECSTDPALRAEVEALLRAAARSDGFLERPATDAVRMGGRGERSEIAPGLRVGPWMLERLLGSGGMGSVFLAARADGQFEQRVALKLIRSEQDTHELLKRFRNERQLLAALDHPGIARLLDGGSTEDGRPFLVMEYVEGEPLDAYCAHHRLTVGQRIGLFVKICDAVAHAHRNLVVHRDIKPGNVLVSSSGEPKLIDFGIAKVLGAEASQATVDLTAAGLRRLTPSYASPEQVRGDPVTTASDVYSLGVLLYELLTEARPYRIESTEPTAILRIVCEVEPPLPSAAVRNPERERELRGDLDAITMKALRKEPGRRYVTVDQFAEDLRFHLAGLPVYARPDTVRYRAGKFVRRHFLAVGAATAAVLALIAGLATSLNLYFRSERERVLAERRFDDVRELATGLLFDVHDKIKDLTGSMEAREFIATTALERLDRLSSEELDADTPLRFDIARGYLRLGDVLGRAGSGSLGRTAEAGECYRKAFALLSGIRQSELGGSNLDLALAMAHSRLGDVAESESRSEDAIVEFEAALAARSAAERFRDVPPGSDPKLSRLHGRLFDLLSALGRFAEAHDHLLEATRLAEIGAEANEGNRKAEGSLGVQWNKLGEALASAGDLDRSAVSHARALGVFDRLVERSPEDARSRRHRAISLGFLGRRLDERGRPEEAGPVLERAVTDFASLVDADPRNARAREDLAVTCNHLGDAYGHLGCTEEALDLYLRALEIRREIVQLAGQDAWARRSLTISLELAAGSLRELGFLDRAAEFQRESFELARSLVDDDPQDVRARRRQVLACLGLADLEGRLADAGGAAGERLGRWRAAREWNSLGLEILETVRSRGGLQAADEDLVRQAREHLDQRCGPALAGLGD